MQFDPQLFQSILFVVLNAIGVFALIIILAYTVYGTDAIDED